MKMPNRFPPGIRSAIYGLLPLMTAYACAKSPEKSSERSIPDRYVEGSFVVSAESTTSEEQLKSMSDGLASSLGCKAKAPTRVNWGETSDDGPGALSEALRNTYNLSFENCDFSRDGTRAIVEGLAGSAGVLSAEAEALAQASPILENDPDKRYQGHLPFIKRDEACAAADRQGKPVIVAVIDSGVMFDHPDLEKMMYRDANGTIIGANFVGSGAQMPPDDNYGDPNGHGTHVAGLVAAQANNGQGVVGVASCANVKIMPIRVLGESGSGSSLEIERGVKWAVDHGAQILNLSLGYKTEVYNTSDSAFERPLYSNVAAKDVVVFAAAGNDGEVMGADAGNGYKTYHFPSSWNTVIGVAATNNSGSLTSFSNRGDKVDIAAPGSNVLATINTGDYGRMSGTSMASPVAAGAYALALASARAGIDSDRVDADVARELISKATLDGVSIDAADVESGGVIDTLKLVKAMTARFPKAQPIQPTQPVTQPSQPTQPTQPAQPAQPIVSEPVAPKTFAFSGMTSGQKAGWPQDLKVENLPQGTYVVYFYWGTSPYSFSKAYAKRGTSTATASDSWYLYGNRTLTAVAYNYYGRALGTTSITLKGH